MRQKIRQVLEISEVYLERFEMEGYEETVDQTYNDVFFQTRTILENIGGQTTSLRIDFQENVTRHFTPDSLSNIISILKTAELFLEENHDIEDTFWRYLHPKVKELAKPRFDNGFYADAIVSCLREVNTILKNYVRAATNHEFDGAALMTKAFSVQNPIIQFADLTTENGRNIQLGYMKMFEGAMIGIRNPKSHENLNPDRIKTIHLLFNASFIFIKLEETGVITSIPS